MPAKTPGLLQHGAALRPTEHRHFDTRFREQLGPGSQPEPFAVLSAGAAETGGHHGGDPGPGHAAGIVAAPEIVAVGARLLARPLAGQADRSEEHTSELQSHVK